MTDRCGTVRGYFDHRKANEPTCSACRKAKREYQIERAKTYGLCRISGCSDPVESKRLCSKHLDRDYRHGDPLGARPGLADRFRAALASGSIPAYAPHLGECVEWGGAVTTQGYGRIADCRVQLLAHRVSWELNVGPIPDGLTIDHLCRNRTCVNPTHLEPVTREENSRREMEARALSA